MIIEEKPIGTIFQYEYMYIEVIEDKGSYCEGCCFYEDCPNNYLNGNIMSCSTRSRKDKNNVIYKSKYD